MAKKKIEQVDLASLRAWEQQEPNVAFKWVNGELVEVPVPKVATRKNKS
jgi:hypothetical protein